MRYLQENPRSLISLKSLWWKLKNIYFKVASKKSTNEQIKQTFAKDNSFQVKPQVIHKSNRKVKTIRKLNMEILQRHVIDLPAQSDKNY